MFNLLPDNLKNKVKSEYRLNFLIMILLFIIILQISSLIFLFPSWLISMNKENEIMTQAERVNKSLLDSKIININAKVDSINSTLKIINSTIEYPKFKPFIDSIIFQKIKDISISEFDYSSNNDITGKIILAGIATTREALVLFVSKLEQTKLFDKVDLPISNFTKNKDIDFSINMTILKK